MHDGAVVSPAAGAGSADPYGRKRRVGCAVIRPLQGSAVVTQASAAGRGTGAIVHAHVADDIEHFRGNGGADADVARYDHPPRRSGGRGVGARRYAA